MTVSTKSSSAMTSPLLRCRSRASQSWIAAAISSRRSSYRWSTFLTGALSPATAGLFLSEHRHASRVATAVPRSSYCDRPGASPLRPAGSGVVANQSNAMPIILTNPLFDVDAYLADGGRLTELTIPCKQNRFWEGSRAKGAVIWPQPRPDSLLLWFQGEWRASAMVATRQEKTRSMVLRRTIKIEPLPGRAEGATHPNLWGGAEHHPL
jgi:hypothetical protein